MKRLAPTADQGAAPQEIQCPARLASELCQHGANRLPDGTITRSLRTFVEAQAIHRESHGNRHTHPFAEFTGDTRDPRRQAQVASLCGPVPLSRERLTRFPGPGHTVPGIQRRFEERALEVGPLSVAALRVEDRRSVVRQPQHRLPAIGRVARWIQREGGPMGTAVDHRQWMPGPRLAGAVVRGPKIAIGARARAASTSRTAVRHRRGQTAIGAGNVRSADERPGLPTGSGV